MPIQIFKNLNEKRFLKSLSRGILNHLDLTEKEFVCGGFLRNSLRAFYHRDEEMVPSKDIDIWTTKERYLELKSRFPTISGGSRSFKTKIKGEVYEFFLHGE